MEELKTRYIREHPNVRQTSTSEGNSESAKGPGSQDIDESGEQSPATLGDPGGTTREVSHQDGAPPDVEVV